MSLRPKHRDILHLITLASVHNHKQSTEVNGKKDDLYTVKFRKLTAIKIFQVLANPESSDSPENNDPPKVETSKLISLFVKNNEYDRYPEHWSEVY